MPGNCLRTDKEKGEAFLQQYKRQLQENAELQLKTKWDKINSKIPKNKIWDYERKVTDAELWNVIKSITQDTTCGPDKVVYSDLKILAESREMFNDLLQSTPHLKKAPSHLTGEIVTLVSSRNQQGSQNTGKHTSQIMRKDRSQESEKPARTGSKLTKQVGAARPMRSTTSNVKALVNRMQPGLQGKRHLRTHTIECTSLLLQTKW